MEMLASQKLTNNNMAHSLTSRKEIKAKEIKINIFDAPKQKLSFSCPHVVAETKFLKVFTLAGVLQNLNMPFTWGQKMNRKKYGYQNTHTHVDIA